MNTYQLKAGAGSSIIRFPDGFFPTDLLNGVHDDPSARILVLDAGERVAVVSIEMVNVPDDNIDMLRTEVEEITGTPYDHVWVHVTHPITTPHAPGGPHMRADGTMMPVPAGAGGPPKVGPDGKPHQEDPELPRKRRMFTELLSEAVRTAATAAAEGMSDAVCSVHTGRCEVNSNRDVETPFGWWVGINPDGYSNKSMEILRVDHTDGTPIGFLISYGIKPCAIDVSGNGSPDRKVSADVPGVACRMMEEKYGAPCLFCMSAACDQVPREQAIVDVVNDDGTVSSRDQGLEAGYEIVDRLGHEMGEAAIAIAGNEAEPEEGTEIFTASDSATLTMKAHDDRAHGPVKEADFEPGGEVELGADVICFGDTALVAVKPEINSQTEKELKEASPFAHTLLISMVNGGMKYLPDKAAYDKVTYEALGSKVMPGSAEKWVSCAVDLLKSVKEEQG